MTRILLTLLCGSMLVGCSRTDVREMAENVRIQAEGIGAQAEIRRQNARMDAAGDGGYGGVQPPPKEIEPEKAAEPEKAKAPPPQPVYVVVPAY
jgi:hypothetical protein